MTYRFIERTIYRAALRFYSILFQKENVYRVSLDFIVYFGKQYVTIWKRPIPP